ncbi:MAG: phage Gp37/Gp68 family protein [Alphaproteobacteria bacterium]|nr:phage Gp37/Gp68 family protein [Alphaproteobacteria bacterium]
MGEQTAIEWTDHTFNPWWGCTKVSDGCKNCYALTLDRRVGGDHWGPGKPRRTFGDKHWNEPLKWDRKAAADGVRRRVFCASMADVFDDKAPAGARDRLWSLIEATPNLEWLLLTKRPEAFTTTMPPRHLIPNIRLGTTVEHQQAANERLPHLATQGVCGWKTFVSYEPALGPVNWRPWIAPGGAIHWVVAGGESGPGARPAHPDWFRQCRDACTKAGVPFLFKQWGEWGMAAPGNRIDEGKWMHPNGNTFGPVEGEPFYPAPLSTHLVRVGKKKAGRLLDGREHLEFPA